jgi:single-strand DNA-binding protein
MTTTETKPSVTPVPPSEPGAAHRNEVMLVGELAAPPQARVMPSGDEVISFRLTVRAPASAANSKSDSIDCAVWRKDLRARVQKYRVGDVLELTGSVRHRYWRGATGLASRYEVEAEKVRVVTKVRVAKAPPTPPVGPEAFPS